MCCHTDACLGGFVLPFARKLGYPVPAWDFSVPGVTSMSLDSHKFGMAHKVSSSQSAVQVNQACHAGLISVAPKAQAEASTKFRKHFPQMTLLQSLASLSAQLHWTALLKLELLI